MDPQGTIPSSQAQIQTVPTTGESITSTKKTTTSSPSPLIPSAARFAYLTGIEEAQQKANAHARELTKKYYTLDTLERAKKTKALSASDINPLHVQDTYDAVAAGLHKWTVIAKDAVAKGFSPQDREKVAKNYYAKVVAPTYARLGSSAPSLESWMSHAYGSALAYDIDKAYSSNLTRLGIHYEGGEAELARATGTLVNGIGQILATPFEMYKNASNRMKELRKDPKALGEAAAHPWNELMYQAVEATDAAKKDVAGTYAGRFAKTSFDYANNVEFWDKLHPSASWAEASTGFVAEQAAQLPLWVALGQAGKVAKVLPGAVTLTDTLMSTKAGKFALPYLMEGGKGLAIGYLTRPQEDKKKAIYDGLTFMAFHGLFSIGGKGLQKLSSVVESPAAKEAVEKEEARLDLAQKGERYATEEEYYEQHKKEVANNLAVGGVPAQRAIYAAALHHIEEMQGSGKTAAEIKEIEEGRFSHDPAYWSPVLSASRFVRSILGDRKLSDIAPGSEEEKFISSRLATLITDAVAEMPVHVEGMKQERAEGALKAAQAQPKTRTLDYYRARAAKIVEREGLGKMVSPEQMEKLAQQEFLKAQERATKLAAERASKTPLERISEAAAKDKAPKTQAPMVPNWKTRTERRVDRYGQPMVSYSVQKDYKVYMQKKLGENWNSKGFSSYLKNWYEDLSDADFNKDLTEFFYPKELKDAGIFFEHQNTGEGKQNPNLLAFMYNYTSLLPKELGKEVERRLIESVKVQKFMKGSQVTEDQLDYYAKTMWNHMDNFLGSGRWPKESNIFRSSQERLFPPTKYQRELLEERTEQERKIMKRMYGVRTKHGRTMMEQFDSLAQARLAAFDQPTKSSPQQSRIMQKSDEIADMLTDSGEYQRWEF